MLFSIAVIMFSGFLLGWICRKVKFPPLFGMIIAGILLGPHAFGLIDVSVLNISAELRKIALIIILIRAGLKLDTADLKKNGRPAVLMCFVPACAEMLGMVLLAPLFLGMSRLDAAVLGAVIGAVSPAVIVPKMIDLIDGGYGTEKGIPQMILAGASVDDVFVIVMFSTFTGLAAGGSVSVMSFVNIPISIILGIGAGILVGMVLYKWFTAVKMRSTVKMIMLLCTAFCLSAFEDGFSGKIPFASLIGVMAVGMTIKQKDGKLAAELSAIYDKLWIPSEILLFVLVGASVEIESAVSAGISAIMLILCVLIFRMAGVFICTFGTKLNRRERLFCMLAYMPKATVQAAIGGIPLVMGLACGETVLTVSVIAIMITAPLGAFAIDLTYKRCLTNNKGHL